MEWDKIELNGREVKGREGKCKGDREGSCAGVQVGMLQPFYIDRMKPDIKNVVVADAVAVEKRLRMVQLYQKNLQNQQAREEFAGPRGPRVAPESGRSPLRSPFGAIQAPRGFVRPTPGSDE